MIIRLDWLCKRLWEGDRRTNNGRQVPDASCRPERKLRLAHFLLISTIHLQVSNSDVAMCLMTVICLTTDSLPRQQTLREACGEFYSLNTSTTKTLIAVKGRVQGHHQFHREMWCQDLSPPQPIIYTSTHVQDSFWKLQKEEGWQRKRSDRIKTIHNCIGGPLVLTSSSTRLLQSVLLSVPHTHTHTRTHGCLCQVSSWVRFTSNKFISAGFISIKIWERFPSTILLKFLFSCFWFCNGDSKSLLTNIFLRLSVIFAGMSHCESQIIF